MFICIQDQTDKARLLIQYGKVRKIIYVPELVVVFDSSRCQLLKHIFHQAVVRK